jgi:hypothetical protein
MLEHERNVSWQSLDHLAQFFRAEIFLIQHIWAAFGRILTEANAVARLRDDSWEQDWFLAKYAKEYPGIGIVSHYLPPRDFFAFPAFDIDSYVERLAQVPGLTKKRSRGSGQVSALFNAEASGSMFISSRLEEFYDLRQRVRRHGDSAMIQLSHALSWLRMALGKLFTGIALTPESNPQELLEGCWRRWFRIWELKDVFEENMNIPELIQWKSDVFYGAEIREVGLTMNPSRQGQPPDWQDHWGWLSSEADPELALAGLRMAAHLMTSLPIYLFFQHQFWEADSAVTTSHLLAATVFRRWTLQLQAMSWLETALQREWKHVRSQDLTAFAFSALRPHWPRSLFGLSHRSMDIKAALKATRVWDNFRYSLDATFVPQWETNVATVWGLFSATPGIIRIPSEHYDESVWCRREHELFDYLRDEDDFLDGRYLIELPQTRVGSLGDLVATPYDEDHGSKQGQFPRITMVFKLFPFEAWENQLLACVAAVRLIFMRMEDPELTKAVCLRLAKGFLPPKTFEPLTDHPDGWLSIIMLFERFQDQWGDNAEDFPITVVPDNYDAIELGRDIESLSTIIDLSDGACDQVDVLAAFEWNRTIVPALVGDNRYGNFFCVDYRNLTEEDWARQQSHMVIRGVNRIRTAVPLWYLQTADQRVDEWSGMGTSPVFTQYVAGQWSWMWETLLEPEWPANFQGDCKLQFSQKLLVACAATRERGDSYYQDKINSLP